MLADLADLTDGKLEQVFDLCECCHAASLGIPLDVQGQAFRQLGQAALLDAIDLQDGEPGGPVSLWGGHVLEAGQPLAVWRPAGPAAVVSNLRDAPGGKSTRPLAEGHLAVGTAVGAHHMDLLVRTDVCDAPSTHAPSSRSRVQTHA